MGEPANRGERNALGQIARPIRLPWKCHQTGDCCRTNLPLTVTAEERTLLEQNGNLGRRYPEFALHPDEQRQREALQAAGEMIMPPVKFYTLDRTGGGGCPFLVENSCVVYSVRPYNCRRFMCGRPDPTQESFEEGGPMGCYNTSDRLNTSLRWMEFYKGNERRAQNEWAKEHGWAK